MDSRSVIQEISKTAPIATREYSGDLDCYHLRTGSGEEKWYREYYQRYKGRLLQDCMHGRGRYSWIFADKKTLYDGFFYANSLEGYGIFSYSDSSLFEGLFKGNRRFGPGVYTYADGRQDVGLWCDKDLMRLCTTVKPEWVPRIARSSTAKVTLLKYKKLVSLCGNERDRAKDILEMLEANEDVMKQSDKLYNIHIRNPKSHFFNTRLYDENYFCTKDCYIEIALTPEEEIALQYQNTLAKLTDVTPEPSQVIQSEEVCDNGFTIIADNQCFCDDPKQIRLRNINSELEHTEEVLQRIEKEIKIAKCLKEQARRYMSLFSQPKTVNWEFNLVMGGSNTPSSASEQNEVESGEGQAEDGEKSEVELDCNFEEETDEVDYETAARRLDAALDAQKLLLLKKTNLLSRLEFENMITEKREEEEEERPKKTVLVTDLLAWNNEEIAIEMLKHVFLYRNFEKEMPYTVGNLLIGDRSEFRKPGTYEEECISFLSECSNGNPNTATELFYKHDLNPDLCDDRGNTGMIYAAARDKVKIIKTLVNFGAKVDIMNDECLTPLNLCVARYLAILFNVIDWEKAFLKPKVVNADDELKIREWRPHISLTSIGSMLSQHQPKAEASTTSKISKGSHAGKFEAYSEIFASSIDAVRSKGMASLSEICQRYLVVKRSIEDFQENYGRRAPEGVEQSYVLSTECIKPPPPPKSKKGKGKKDKKEKGKKDKKGKESKSSKSSKGSKKSTKALTVRLSLLSIKSEISPEELARDNKLYVVQGTIVALLKYGADPNVGEVPMPALLLAVFAKKPALVEMLLDYKADPNVTTLDEHLTAMHVVVSLVPCEELIEILDILFKYSANPNCRSNKNHWLDQKQEILAKHQLIEDDNGKTPLHILCMRYDFISYTNDYLNQMAMNLINNGASHTELYLGHTPLSLAIIRGNIKLLKSILYTKKVNPNYKLGEDMGVALTLLILIRNDNILSLPTCQEIIQVLLDYKANPFNNTGERGNAVEFMNMEHEVPKSDKANVKKAKGGTKLAKAKSAKKGKNKKAIPTTLPQNKEYLKQAAKVTLEKHIKGWAVKYLYFFVELEDYYDDVAENMARLLTPVETVKLAQLHVNRGAIPAEKSLTYNMLYDLIEFIINVNIEWEDSNKSPSRKVDIDKMLENFVFAKTPKEPDMLNLPEPEVERYHEKYKVCFYCYRRKDRLLFVCPCCNVIYFCSEECNKLSNNQKNQFHKCKILFYNSQKAKEEQRLKQGLEDKPSILTIKRLPQLRKERGWTEEMFQEDTFARMHIKPHKTRRLHLTRPRDWRVTRLMLEGKDKGLKGVSRGRIEAVDKRKGKMSGKEAKSKRGKSGRRRGSQSSSSRGKTGKVKGKSKMRKGRSSSGDSTSPERGVKAKRKTEKGKSNDSEKKKKGGKPRSGSSGGKEGGKKGKAKTEDRYKDKGGKKGEKGAAASGQKGGAASGPKGGAAFGPKGGAASGPKGAAASGPKGGAASGPKGGTVPGPKAVAAKNVSVQREQRETKAKGGDGIDKSGERAGGDGKNLVLDMPLGRGALMELKRRLPNKYQYFLEKISEYWPDFDISMLFLPYACYSDGQLYYRFLTSRPLFMETYSNV